LSNIEKKSIQLRTGLFSSRTLEYVVRISKRAKKNRIKVDVEGVEVVLPERTHPDQAERMMREYSDWILKKVALFEELKKRQLNRGTEIEKTLLFHGKKMTVIREPDPTGRGKFRVDSTCIYLPVNGHTKSQAALLFQKHLKDQARKEINVLAEIHSQKMGTTYTTISIRDQRTRWGACSARGSLSFNWRLVMAPPEVAEYVIIHELAHRVEMNHSPRFWKLVEKYCPDYKKWRLWLKNNGPLLRPDFVSLV
jgi:predicted metal-dependent hydrolase